MSIFDIFSGSILFTIIISIIIFGILFAYVSNKISEQNHKLNSMVNLVSILADDMQKLKGIQPINNDVKHLDISNTCSNQILEGGSISNFINVSDCDETQSECSLDDGSEISNEDDSTDDDSECDYSDDESVDDTKKNIISFEVEPADTHIVSEDTEQNIKTIHIEPINTFHEIKEEPVIELQLTNEDLADLKETEFESSEVLSPKENIEEDYKKLTLPKLRQLVVSKKMVEDSSKMTKKDILKLLETK